MKPIISCTIIIFILAGCESRIEIPVDHAGVVIDHEHVEPQVLRHGEHLVNFGSEVIVYDVNDTKLEMEFDFIFRDVSEGDIKLTVEFKPIADSLPSFYKKYKSIYVTPVMQTKSRQIVRELLESYDPNELSSDELKTRINKTLANDPQITDYVKVYKVDILDLSW
jgi:hypothetical protein